MNCEKSITPEKAPWLLTGWLLRKRFLKFGTVGLAGTFVNLMVLYLAKEFVFRGIENPHLQLNLSLAAAIFVSTLHNFMWNRAWTWGDRKAQIRTQITIQFIQYCAACWLSIVLQFVFTILFGQYMYYLPANILAIAITAILNYLINHVWTFRAQNIPITKSGER